MARLVTQTFVETIKEIKRLKGSQKTVATFLGVSDMQVGRWLKGEGETIKESTFNKIYPKIKEIYEQKEGNAPKPKADNSTLRLFESFSHDDLEILKYLNRPENRRKKLELLLEIEDSKTQVSYNSESSENHEVNDCTLHVAEKQSPYGAKNKN